MELMTHHRTSSDVSLCVNPVHYLPAGCSPDDFEDELQRILQHCLSRTPALAGERSNNNMCICYCFVRDGPV